MTDDEREAARVQNEELVKAYRLTFRSPWGQTVMLDLMKFCHFRTPTPDEDRDIAEGKRRVFLRIQSFLSFTPEQLGVLFAGQPIPTGETDGQ